MGCFLFRAPPHLLAFVSSRDERRRTMTERFALLAVA
jgi:hypothetical protein